MTTKDVKFWLEEKDLKTPKHDEIVLYCFNNPLEVVQESLKEYVHFDKLSVANNTETIEGELIKEYFMVFPDGEVVFLVEKLEGSIIEQTKKIGRITEEIKESLAKKEKYNTEENRDEYYVRVYGDEVIKKTASLDEEKGWLKNLKELWENPKDLTEKVKKEIAEFKEFDNKRKRICPSCFEVISKTMEYSLGNGKWNIGFIDLKITLKPKSYKGVLLFENKYFEEIHFFLEIKPSVISIGETMRQINFYRDYIPREKNYKVILVTETEGLKDIFESQKVGYYQYNKKSQKELF